MPDEYMFELCVLLTYRSQLIDNPSRLVDDHVYITRLYLPTLLLQSDASKGP